MGIATSIAPAYPEVKRNIVRVESIDLLRGLVMIIMALDHIRDYFHVDASLFDPGDLSKTNMPLFFTRWITNFCAPLFMFLSGTSAYLVGKRKGKKALSKFLLTRGLWLVFLELTIVNFGWYFNFPEFDFLVIWALGISMIALAGFIYLPIRLILFIGLAMLFGHNLLDNVHVPGTGAASFGWALLHEPNSFKFYGINLTVGYPIIPWIGIMALGYCLGKLYGNEVSTEKRKKTLIVMGVAAIVLFAVIRYINVYGDPSPWSRQYSSAFTILSFLNVSKYPPSLLYLLVTLGPALLFLAFTENNRSSLASKIRIIGRVPMFYYLVHLYLIHTVAFFATYLCGHTPGDMILDNWIAFEPKLHGYGFSLGIVYLVWFSLVIILYFLCRSYDTYKKSHHQWWLSYF